MAEPKTRLVEVAVTILLAAAGVFAAVAVFEVQEHHNAAAWFAACAASLIAAVLFPLTVFVFYPWIRNLSESVQPNISGEKEPVRLEKVSRDQPAQADIQPTSERIFANVTPDYLAEFYERLTGLEADLVVQRYLNKWLKVSGRLEDISRHEQILGPQYFAIHLRKADGSLSFVSMFFNDPKSFPRLEILKRGDPLTVVGRVHRIGRKSVVLEDCELTDEIPVLPEDDALTSLPKSTKRTNNLKVGERLLVKQSLYSSNGRLRLDMLEDGNLAVFFREQTKIWATDTTGSGAKYLELRDDGTLALCESNGSAVWEKGSWQGGETVVMQDDGNLVLYADGGRTVIWASGIIVQY